jgi:hypothetical protein
MSVPLDEGAPPRWSAADTLLVTAAVVLYAALAITSMRGKSATFDEGAHLPAGYTYLTRGDHRLNPEHPPLLKGLAAVPLLLLPIQAGPVDDEAWVLRRQWEFGRRFLYRWNDGDRLLFWGRLPVVALGALLCVAVFLWTRHHWGRLAGALALVLCALSPEVLAHGQIVTTDLAVTLFLFLSVILFERVIVRVTPGRVVLCGLATGAALATKFSALVLGPILLGLTAVALWRRSKSDGPRSLELVGALASIGVLALGVLWASYGFERRLSRDPAVEAAFEWSRVTPEAGPVAAATRIVRATGVLPEAYVFGFLRFYRHSETRPAFLMGQLSNEGWWYYFPATFALKTPLALILLLVLALALAAPPGRTPFTTWVLWLPVIVYIVVTQTRGLNIGHRHLLPLHPFVFAAAARVLVSARAHRIRQVLEPMVWVLAAWYAVSSLRVYPHFLAYFNEAAGGPSQGYRYLVDSNLDWGQDLKGLAVVLRERGIPEVKLSYFGSADPEYYGIRGELLPSQMLPPPKAVTHRVEAGDIVAISATNLQGVYLDPSLRPFLDDLKSRAPLLTVGHSIFVYRIDRARDLVE